MRTTTFLALCLAAAGCGTPEQNPDPTGVGGETGDDDDDDDDDDDHDDETDGDGDTDGEDTDGPDDDGDTDDTGADVDHALGVITLSEAHSAGGGTAAGAVSAAFMPDAAAVTPTCAEMVAGCRIWVVPECESGCDADQYCGFDDSCAATCLDICDADCGEDEVCYFSSPGEAACRDREDFDAGSLTFSGTTTPITLFPPYVAEGFDTGSPFSPGSQITVSASGASGAGFDPFEATFTATTLLQSNLDDITVAEAYGSGDMPVHWSAGEDDIEVTVTVTALDGAYGTITCVADDAAGTFDVPRAAMRAALDDEAPSAVSVSVVRSRTEEVRGLSTTGMLAYADVQPVAWLELTTMSSASHAVEGCGFGELVCGDECIDVLSDPDNCGDCGEVCETECYDGECLAEDTDEACSDGEDNDQDGYYDCEDWDCSMNPEVTVCMEGPEDNDAACSDGFDNDGDGYTDCVDFDCSDNPDVTVC